MDAFTIAIAVLVLIGGYCTIKAGRDMNKAQGTKKQHQDLTLATLPGFVRQLKDNGRDKSWCQVYIPATSKRPVDETNQASLQFTLEAGTVSLDWFTYAPVNIADKGRVAQFAKEQGFDVQELEIPGRGKKKDKYLRIQGGDVVKLAVKIAEDMYAVSPETTFQFDAEGFKWNLDAAAA